MGTVTDNLTWVALIQLLIVVPLLMPGMVGLATLYILLGQGAVFAIAYMDENVHNAVTAANGVAIGVLILVFAQWNACEGPMDCVVASSRAGATFAIVIGVWLSNRFILGLAREEQSGGQGTTRSLGNTSDPMNQGSLTALKKSN